MLEIVVSSADKLSLEKTHLFNHDNIIDVSLLLSVGKIKNISSYSVRHVCGYDIAIKEKLEQLKHKILQEKNVRIWYSSMDNEDVCLLYFVVNYLSNIKELNMYVCDVANEKHFSLAGYATLEVNYLLDKTKKLTQTEIEQYKKLWDQFEEDNSDLRILNNSILESHNYEYLDDKIIELLKKYDSVYYFEFVGECLRTRLCGFYMDIIFITRIDEMIKSGRIEVCEIRQEKNFMGKMIDKKYIKASN